MEQNVLAPARKSSSIEMVIGKWKTNLSSLPVYVARPTIEWATAKIRRWVEDFPAEGTLVESLYGVPSILASINCVVDKDNHHHLISISPNPSNIGIATLADGRLKDGINYWLSLYKGLRAVHNNEDDVPDDSLWISHIRAKEASFGAIPFIVRSRVPYAGINGFREKSLSPVTGGRSNYYGVAMGFGIMAGD